MKRWVAVAFCSSLCGCESTTEITIGWAPIEPAAEISKTLGPILEKSYRVSTRRLADSEALIDALLDGSVDIAIVEQPAFPIPNLSVLTPLFPSVLHVLARADGVDPNGLALRDVVSGKVYAGPAGSAGYRLVMSLAETNVIPDLDAIELLESPLGDEPDVYFIFGGLLGEDALSRLQGFRLVSLGNVSDLGRGAWVEGVAIRYLHLDPFILPRGLYPQLSDAPILSLAVQSLLVTRSDLEADVAYDVTQLVKQHVAQIEAIYPLARKTIHQPIDDSKLNLPLHPGARRYLERDGPTFLERYAELLALLATLTIAATSAVIAVVRMRRHAKKDRIDLYFDRVLALRTSLQIGDVSAERLYTDVSELQDVVTRLVVEERIAADTSFVGFLALSNQVLAEMQLRRADGDSSQNAVSSS